MKAIEFQSEVGNDQTLRIPASVSEQVPRGQPLRVLILMPEGSEDQGWEQLAAADMGMGYADGDAIYDQLSGR
jgi:hypothetical protein